MITFEKVPAATFMKDVVNNQLLVPELASNTDFMMEAYTNVSMPERATAGSAGYDFHTPFAFELRPGKSIVIPTGIRCVMPSGFVLLMFPRSGLGFKFGLRLENTTGIIDSDYCQADNFGHIMVKLHNPSETTTIRFERDDKICQGIITKYFVADDDAATAERHGGFGSTDTVA